jgi:hypothetical protein
LAEAAAKLSFLCDGVIWWLADGDSAVDAAETRLRLVLVLLVDGEAYLELDLMPS